MTNILSVLLAAFAVLSGPDGKLNVTLESSPDRAVLYSVDYCGETMLMPASLGLVAQDCDYDELIFTGMDQEEIKVDYRLDRAKTSHVSHDAIRYITHFKTPEGRLLDIEWHISDNDVAFRYCIPRDTETGSIRVMKELTCFDFPQGTTIYMCPQSDPMVGCMEFGGTFLNTRLDRANGRPGADGKVGGTQRRTTDAFQLATAVIFQNPIQNFALAPNNLTDAPAEALEFMRNVPTVWDETRYIAGAPAHSAVIARRSGDVWYVGAINAAEENFAVDVNEIAATLGKENAAAIHTAGGRLVRKDGGFRKPLAVAVNDGAVLVLW